MENTKRVVITGLGAISPIGNSVESVWESVLAGRCGIDRITGFEDTPLPISVAAQVRDFKPADFGMNAGDARRYDRFTQFAVASAEEAVRQSGLVSGENIDPDRFGVYAGSGIGGINTLYKQAIICHEEGPERVSPLFVPMMISNIAGGNIAIRQNARGVCLASVSTCATSTNTIGEAFLAIKYGRADAIIAGGAEAAILPLAIGGFANCKALSLSEDPALACLPFDSRRGGFVMGEGAAMIVLEEFSHAKARGAEIIAEVVGYGNTCDAYHYTAPRPDGTVTAKAIKDSLVEGGFKESDSLYINAHGTGTALNDKAETVAIKLALGEDLARKASISSTKSMHGHMLGAAGAIELVISALAVKNGIVPPTIGLTSPDPECDLNYTPLVPEKKDIDFAVSESLGFGGHNACVAIKKI